MYLRHEDLGTVEAHTAHYGEHSLDESNVEHWLCELKVTKMSWTFGHPSHTCITLDLAVNRTQTRVTQTPRFGLPSLHSLRMFYHHH
jgi:hypothetical protein